jgi:uncharacterized protein (DUF2236 family)
MARTVLPTDEEVLALVPGPGSVTWRRAGDARTLLAAGYALVLQVAHPTVGAGVAQHSNYRTDPWGRLLRTLDLVNTLVYGEPQRAAHAAREVRARHRSIRGTLPDGRRYSALEPHAYAWVWATLFAGVLAAHERFSVPLAADEHEPLWGEWRSLGRLLGVRDGDLPATLVGFHRYFEAVQLEVLQDNESVRGVLASIDEVPGPPLPLPVRPAWWLARLPAARALRLATVGLLPELLRRRFGLGWSGADEAQLALLCTASRAATPLLPPSVRVFGPAYLRWRAASERA